MSIIKSIPQITNLEVSNICNLNCPICIEKAENQGYLSLELTDKIIQHNKDILSGQSVWLHYRGEPYTNKEIFGISDMLYTHGIKSRLSTNGILLNEKNILKTIDSHIGNIVISVVTLDEKKYAAMRGQNHLDRVLYNIKQLCDATITSDVKIQVMGLDYGQSQQEIDEFINYFHERNIEVAMHKYSDRAGLSRYNPTSSSKSNDTIRRVPCNWIYNNLVILYNGDITTCYFDLGCRNVIASIKDYNYSIMELWNSEKIKNLRKQHEASIYQGACEQCVDWIYYNESVPKELKYYVRIYPLVGESYYV